MLTPVWVSGGRALVHVFELLFFFHVVSKYSNRCELAPLKTKKHPKNKVLMSFLAKLWPLPNAMVMSQSVLSSSRPLLLSSSQIPLCRVIRFNIDYTIHFIEEMAPEVSKTPLYLPALFLPFLTPFVFISNGWDWALRWAPCNSRTSVLGWVKVLILLEEEKELPFDPLRVIVSIRWLMW